MKFNIFKSNLERIDLDRVYSYAEYEKTLAYAEKNISIDGVLKYYKAMKADRHAYNSDIDRIVEPEREKEEKRYWALEKWTRARQISAWVCVGSLVMCWILDTTHPVIVEFFFRIVMIAFVVFVIAKISETVFGMIYKQYVRNITKQIKTRNRQFEMICQRYYKEIDDLYLRSLSPEHRELVLMRREQAEQHNARMQMAAQEYREVERSRKVQEDILEIQKERLAMIKGNK